MNMRQFTVVSPEESSTTPVSKSLRLLRCTAQVALVVGALGSVALMLYVGHRNQSVILMVLFAGWVLAPFAALAWADRSPKFSPASGRATLQVLMLLLALVSLAAYARVAFGAPLARPAAPFLLVPLGAWLLLALILPLAKRKSSGAPDSP